MNTGRLVSLYLFFAFTILLGLSQELLAQAQIRVPFKHKIGSTSVPNNIFQIRGDFTLIGNTNLTVQDYAEDALNSGNQMIYVDVDQDITTFNSSSATLLLSDENGADPNCTDIIYAGLYWSGRVQTPGLTFELTKQEGFLDPVTLDAKKDTLLAGEIREYMPFQLNNFIFTDVDGQPFPFYEFASNGGDFSFTISFNNDNTLTFFRNDEYSQVEDLVVTESAGIVTATFKPIEFSDDGMDFTLYGLVRPVSLYSGDYEREPLYLMLESTGTYTPLAYYTREFDKRKLKLKPPGAEDYQEITASGNAILFPDQELKEIYVGYADVTDLVKSYGAGSYTVADLALMEGRSDETGMFGNWGMIVVYQNSKMNFRNVTVFDGYTFIETLNGQEQFGELEIKGFGAIEEGPVSMKLGLMASEGDINIGGDYLEILSQSGTWTRLQHPSNTFDNFFNSSIYTPVKMKDGNLVENERFPKLKNNTGIDLLQWEVPNPDNSLITNNQSSAKFRYGTTQDLYALYAFAFSVSSYSPNIEAHHQIKSINGATYEENDTVKPGEEMILQVDIRNTGSEATEQNQLVIPIPYNAVFIRAEPIPSGYGTVRFEPNMGVAGSIVWEIGDIPIPASPDEIIASLQYALKFTEDCFVLANDNCESLLSVTGSVSGQGTVSKQKFSSIPFIKGYKDEACEGNAIYGALEIPISGKAEYAAAKCPDFELFSSLNLDNIPVFCYRDSPTDLADLISPSQEGFSVYFYTEETGGTPLTNYYVNTGLIGVEKIWVSEGPQGSCTGLRIPLELTVIPTSPQPTTQNLQFCMEETSVPYELLPEEGYTLRYYPDNDPSTAPLDRAPALDLSVAKTYSIWVSQYKEGECESPRKEVSILIEDCSLRPVVDISISSNVETFTAEGQEVVFTITVKNPGKVPLYNVYVNEFLSYNTWIIPELGPEEEIIYQVNYIIGLWDMVYKFVRITAQSSGNTWDGEFVSDEDIKEISGINFPPGFLEYTVDTEPASCENEGNGKGKILLHWPQPQTGFYFLTLVETGELEQVVTFAPATNDVIIEAPAGTYSLELQDLEGNKHLVGTVTIPGLESVEFEVPEAVSACGEYLWNPTKDAQVDLLVFAPDGNTLASNSDGSYLLVQTGTYTIRGSTIISGFCPTTKTFEAEITQPSEVALDQRPFCSEDTSTTVDLIDDTQGLEIRWFKKNSDQLEELSLFADSRQLLVSELGEYRVTLTSMDGCLIGQTDFEVAQSSTDPPVLESLYSYCPARNDRVEIEAGSRFKEVSWILNGNVVSNDPIFVPSAEGFYQLEAIDFLGCSFFAEFEVEQKCEPEVKVPNALWLGDASRLFEIYPDNMVDEIEVKIFNRWGQLIYHCEDKAPMNEVKSTCVWDGTYDGKEVTNGSYVAIIRVKNHRLNLTRSIRTSILVID